MDKSKIIRIHYSTTGWIRFGIYSRLPLRWFKLLTGSNKIVNLLRHRAGEDLELYRTPSGALVAMDINFKVGSKYKELSTGKIYECVAYDENDKVALLREKVRRRKMNLKSVTSTEGWVIHT